jgi:hypothetical protein
VEYDAAWLHIDPAAGEDWAAPAVRHVEGLCRQTGRRGILVTQDFKDMMPPSLARFAGEQTHITRRSHEGVYPGDGPVLVEQPEDNLLALAHGLARGTSLCAIESGMFGLAGWATATVAIDLATGLAPPPLNRHISDLLGRLMLKGNNGWTDISGKRDAARILEDLLAADPSLDADFIAGYVIGRGARAAGAWELRKAIARRLLPARRGRAPDSESPDRAGICSAAVPRTSRGAA